MFKNFFIIFIFLPVILFADKYDKAQEYMKYSKYDEAIKLYKEILKTDTASYTAEFKLAQAYAFSGKRQEAIKAYTQFLNDHPGDPDGLLGRGRVYAWEDKFNLAENDLIAVTRSNPQYADAWSALGDLYRWNDYYEEAIVAYTKWRDLNPENPEPYENLAKTYKAARNFSKARELIWEAEKRGTSKTYAESFLRDLNRLPGAMPWQASVTYSFDEYGSHSTRADWQGYKLRISREFEKYSIAIEGMRADRFDEYDNYIALDSYIDLWPSAYINLWFAASDDKNFFVNRDYYAEIYQSLGHGYEISGFYRYMDYKTSHNTLWGGSLGKYYGNWYFRDKATVSTTQSKSNVSQRFLIRRYLATVDDYIDLEFGYGRSYAEIGPSKTLELRHSRSFGAGIEKWPWPKLGFGLSVSYSKEDGSPPQRGFTVSIRRRW